VLTIWDDAESSMKHIDQIHVASWGWIMHGHACDPDGLPAINVFRSGTWQICVMQRANPDWPTWCEKCVDCVTGAVKLSAISQHWWRGDSAMSRN